MPRPILLRTDKYPYHVTARSNNREWFYLPMSKIWTIFSELLKELAEDFSVQIHAFVLMSNHFHLLVTTPGMDLDEAMHHFMREGARRINTEANRINHIFGGPYKWSVIASQRYYEHAYRYVAQNPIKAGIVDKVEKYAFSTIAHLHGKNGLHFPITESHFDRNSVMDLSLWQKLDYLNLPYHDKERERVRRALRYSVFSYHRKDPEGHSVLDRTLEFNLTHCSERNAVPEP